jgi:MoaA/NifB/PqqE/SkfB family radical SAM enzyme
MCGNYGDPAAGAYTGDMYKWFRQLNPTITLGMNTNGAIQNTFWWHEIGRLFNQPRDYVVFSIDGLEDTNSVYRKGVNWTKLMQNAQAFIEAGGSAHWDMLIYQHNEHQVDECEQLARDMGFKWFRAKVSKRPLIGRLEWPRNYQAQTFEGAIKCHAQQEKSAYIDARGNLSPCCWIGATQTDFVRTDSVVDFYPKKHATCVATCSTDQAKTAFSNQWRKEIQLC